MRLAMLKLAAFLVAYAGFALLQAVADQQPLSDRLARLGRFARPLARVASLVGITVACMLLGPSMGWTEASLLTTVAVVFVASVFVVLVPVAPRFAWGLAIASPALAGALALGTRWLP